MDLRISVRCHVEMCEIASSHRTLTQEHEPCRTKQETCSWSHLAEESNFDTAGGNETPNKDSQMRGARGKKCRFPAVAAEAARPGHGSKRTRCNPVHGGATVVFCAIVRPLRPSSRPRKVAVDDVADSFLGWTSHTLWDPWLLQQGFVDAPDIIRAWGVAPRIARSEPKPEPARRLQNVLHQTGNEKFSWLSLVQQMRFFKLA